VKTFFIQLHKITGSALSLLFLMWCLTGVVLVFVGFPHASRQQRFEKLDYLSESDFQNLPYFDQTESGKIELEKYQGELVYRKYKGKKSQQVFNAKQRHKLPLFSKSQAICEAEHFINAKVTSVDSIAELDSWIPWGYYKPLLPFFKCYMDDPDHSVLYVSAQSGTVVQHTQRSSRWYARIGAIPHWIYFSQIKQNADVWQITVLILGIISLLVAISGMVVAFFRFKRNSDGKISDLSVYKKWSYKWHHIFGLCIGLLFCIFLLSGIFYATGVPNWISAKPSGKPATSVWNKRSKTDSVIHPSQIWKQLPQKEGVRKIAWESAMGRQVVNVYYDDYRSPKTFIAIQTDSLIPFTATKDEIQQFAQKKFKDQFQSIEIQNKYDSYYEECGMFHHPLPAYKVNLNDGFGTSVFIDPATGKAVEYFNANKKDRRWLTKGLHKFDFSIFNKADWLRKTILIIVCLIGTAVSFTGVLLSWKWIKRMFKKRLKKK